MIACESAAPNRVIQAGPPFAEHLCTLRDAMIAGTGPVHFGNWKYASKYKAEAIAPSVSSLPLHAQQAHSLRQRYAIRGGYAAALAMPSLPMTPLHHDGPQRNEHAQSLVAYQRG